MSKNKILFLKYNIQKNKEKRIYPWMVFECYRIKGKKQESVVLLFNFLSHIL